MSVEHVREICDIADKHCNGYLRFTTRNNIEFILDDEAKAKALKKDLDSRKHVGGSFKFPTGGTGMGITNIVHTQGWVHCQRLQQMHPSGKATAECCLMISRI